MLDSLFDIPRYTLDRNINNNASLNNHKTHSNEIHLLHIRNICTSFETLRSTMLEPFLSFTKVCIIKFFEKVHQLNVCLDTKNVTFMALSAIWHDRLKYVKPIFAL